MPSPFPGMDPFLEDPGLWPDVHHEIISEARAFLGERLRPKYSVRIEDRVYISDDLDPGRSVIIPDLRIGSHPNWGGGHHPQEPAVGGASLDVAEPIVATLLIDIEIHESRIEIIDRATQFVVTVIEVVSPANKVREADGRRSFKRKRQEVMNSASHWVEIDLLRAGLEMTRARILPAYEYLVHVSRVHDRPKSLFLPIRISEPLPTISIPLKPEDRDVPLDLQAVLTTAYERANYDLEIDYKRDPIPPLEGEWAAWADRLLRDKGLRRD
jgi:hypothetical protein